VTLTADHGALHLQVQNDGRSWSGRRRNHHGLGLQTMRSRAEAIGAVLEICRADAGGTIVHCYLPGAHSPRGATNHENASQTFATDS
jgi:signal transduction histidine kinase